MNTDSTGRPISLFDTSAPEAQKSDTTTTQQLPFTDLHSNLGVKKQRKRKPKTVKPFIPVPQEGDTGFGLTDEEILDNPNEQCTFYETEPLFAIFFQVSHSLLPFSTFSPQLGAEWKYIVIPHLPVKLLKMHQNAVEAANMFSSAERKR